MISFFNLSYILDSYLCDFFFFFFFSSRRRHTRCSRDWSSDVCSSDLVGGSELMEHRRDDVPVRAGEHLAENGAGNLNVQDFAFGPAQPCWLEPRRKGVDAHAGLDVVEKLVPGISRFTLTPNLGCRRHR